MTEELSYGGVVRARAIGIVAILAPPDKEDQRWAAQNRSKRQKLSSSAFLECKHVSKTLDSCYPPQLPRGQRWRHVVRINIDLAVNAVGLTNIVTSKDASQCVGLLLCPYPSTPSTFPADEARNTMRRLTKAYTLAVRGLEVELRKLGKQITPRPMFLVQETANENTAVLMQYVEKTVAERLTKGDTAPVKTMARVDWPGQNRQTEWLANPPHPTLYLF
jgi:hypothetical protein